MDINTENASDITVAISEVVNGATQTNNTVELSTSELLALSESISLQSRNINVMSKELQRISSNLISVIGKIK